MSEILDTTTNVASADESSVSAFIKNAASLLSDFQSQPQSRVNNYASLMIALSGLSKQLPNAGSEPTLSRIYQSYVGINVGLDWIAENLNHNWMIFVEKASIRDLLYRYLSEHAGMNKHGAVERFNPFRIAVYNDARTHDSFPTPVDFVLTICSDQKDRYDGSSAFAEFLAHRVKVKLDDLVVVRMTGIFAKSK